jgi:hypothetical protein
MRKGFMGNDISSKFPHPNVFTSLSLIIVNISIFVFQNPSSVGNLTRIPIYKKIRF